MKENVENSLVKYYSKDNLVRRSIFESFAERFWLEVINNPNNGWTLQQLEDYLSKFPQVEEKLTHTFSGGVYIRELLIPKGCIIVGKRHRHETCNILMSGILDLWNGEGKPTIRIEGPLMFTSPPFTKKAAYCVEEAIFINLHPTKETDLEKIEEEFIIPEKEYLLNHQKEISGEGV